MPSDEAALNTGPTGFAFFGDEIILKKKKKKKKKPKGIPETWAGSDLFPLIKNETFHN